MCAGQVAIAFGLHGPSHSAGSGAAAGLEALLVAQDWVASGDADAMLVVAAEEAGPAATPVLAALGLAPPETGAVAVVIGAGAYGPALERSRLEAAWARLQAEGSVGWGDLETVLGAPASFVDLPDWAGFGSVRPPE